MSLRLLTRYGLSRHPPGGGGAKTAIESWATPGATTAPGITRLGWVFTVGAVPVTVEALRHFAAAASSNEWRIMIHRNSDSEIMAQVDIAYVAADEGTWVSEGVTPVVLAASTAYTISGRRLTGNLIYWEPTGVVMASEVTVTNSGVYGSSDARPTTNTGGDYRPVADFEFTV